MAWKERYARQMAFQGIGDEGQEKLKAAKVLIVGMGALGSVIANNLCRAGVGLLRFVDRDYVELSNLQRQVIYNEQDVKDNLPKAIAAAKHLEKVNSTITLEPIVSDVNSGNVEKLLEDIDLVLDGTDNMETRLLVNDACQKHQVPWIYGGALMSYGMSMNIIPGETACFRCFNPNIPPVGSMPTCSSAGVLSMITGIVACIESTEALKILTGSSEVRKTLFVIDVWNNSAQYVEIAKRPECPSCGKKQYDFLETRKG
jgi:molybdopterin/thiamine biosynthesis adenylyltransferase